MQETGDKVFPGSTGQQVAMVSICLCSKNLLDDCSAVKVKEREVCFFKTSFKAVVREKLGRVLLHSDE